MTLEEIEVQNALGTLGQNREFYLFLFQTTDTEIIKFVGRHSKEGNLLRALSCNPNTPFSILRRIYKTSSDNLSRKIAWDRIIKRWERRYNREAPTQYKVRPFIPV